jgi:4-aminobutyrate--pyruvate transaminase
MQLVPDMIVCAKGLSSGYIPISALMINQRVFDAMVRLSDEVGMFGLTMTYSGHPVASAVAREAIRIYEEGDIPARVRELEPYFFAGLRALEDHPLVGEVRGCGLLAAIELVSDKGTRQPFDRKQRVGQICAANAQRRGLLVRAIGNSITMCPPLTISEAEVSELLARLKAALDDTAVDLLAAGGIQ